MPTSTQSAYAYQPQRLELQSYRQQLNSPSNVKVDLDTVKDASQQSVRRGAGALLKTPLAKVMMAIVAVAVVSAAVAVPLALTLGASTTTTTTQVDNIAIISVTTVTTTTVTTATTSTVSTTSSTSSTSTSATTTSTSTTSTSTASTSTSSTSTSTTSTATTSTTTSATSTTTSITTSTTSTSTSSTSTTSTSTSTSTSTTSTTSTSTTSSTSTSTTSTTSTSTTSTTSTSTTSTTSRTTTSTSTSTSTTTTTSTSTTTTTSKTTTTTTTTTTTVTVTLPPTYMSWLLDSNYNDVYNVYNGVGVNNPTFVTPGYNGRGAALSLNATNSQYVVISAYKNMTYTSFTWEIWAYPTSLANYDSLMVGMCQTPATDLCLYLMIRLNATYFAFFGDDCWSTPLYVPINQWHHFGFVYNYPLRTQYIYLNGISICTHTSSGPFMATSGAITIGAINNTGTTPAYFWTGYIDQVTYISQAKTTDVMLSDATLVAYYPFDNGSFADSGPNSIIGTGVNLTSVAGRVNNGISMSASGQYFQVPGLTLMGASYRSYSVALWLYRSSLTSGSGSILHLATSTDGTGTWCLPILGLSSTNQIIGQNWNSATGIGVTGPILAIGGWTHVVTSYSATNGIRLWINGTLIGSSGTFSYSPSGVPDTITLGSSLVGQSYCASGSITKGQFYGMMDELYIYARELNATEVYTLANP